MSRDKHAGQNRYIKMDNSFFETVPYFEYLQTSVADRNYINGEIKSGNIC